MTATVTATPLQGSDRCDRCGQAVKATVRVVLPTGTLDFCQHHFTAHRNALEALAVSIYHATEAPEAHAE